MQFIKIFSNFFPIIENFKLENDEIAIIYFYLLHLASISISIPSNSETKLSLDWILLAINRKLKETEMLFIEKQKRVLSDFFDYIDFPTLKKLLENAKNLSDGNDILPNFSQLFEFSQKK